MRGNPLNTTQSIKISGLGVHQFNNSMAAMVDAYALFEQHLPTGALQKWTAEWAGVEGSQEQAVSFHNSLFVTRSMAHANSNAREVAVTDQIDPLGHMRRMQSTFLYIIQKLYSSHARRKPRTHGGQPGADMEADQTTRR